MTASLPYIRLRDGVYQYERRVPLRIQRNPITYRSSFGGRALFRRSLHTKRRDEAVKAYQAVDRQFEMLLAGQDGTPVRHIPASLTVQRPVTDHDLSAIAERYARLVAEPFERMHRRANVCKASADELQRMESDLESNAEALRAAVRGRDYDSDALTLQPVSEAEHVIQDHGFFAPHGSEYRGAIISAIRSGQEQGYSRIAALSSGHAPVRLGTAVEPLRPVDTLTLGEAVRQYISDRNPPAKAVSEMRLALRQFEQVVGRKSLAGTTRGDATRFVRFLAEQQVGGKTTGSVVRKLSEQSIGKRLRMLGSAIHHVRDEGKYEGENPLANIRLSHLIGERNSLAMPEKRRFQISELNAVFAHPWFTGCKSPTETHAAGHHRLTGSEYWAPVVAVFTGCRAAELGGLNLSEVRLDDAMPHIIIRPNEHRPTKNGKSRSVPILDALLELGFAAYVDCVRKSGATRLFPDWTAIKPAGGGASTYPAWSNARVIRAFNRTVVPAALGDRLAPDARQEVTFHGFRGAFKAMIGTTNNLPINVVHEVVGHAKDGLDARYIGKLSIEETYPFIRSLTYKGLFIPPAPN